jgi:NDP-sugar pyrophosphorylase family protein
MILAAGEGTRLRPLTLTTPKPMLPVAGKPVLEHTLNLLRKHRVSRVVINLYHRPEAVIEHFGGGDADLQIVYSIEPRLLGTAGGVAAACSAFDEKELIVIYGDVLTNMDLTALLAFHRQRAGVATIALYRVPNPTECGLVETGSGGRIVRFVEKPSPAEVFTDWANSGVYVLDRRLLEMIRPDTFCDFGHDLFPKLLHQGESLYGYPLPDHEYLIDIGSLEKYRRAEEEWPGLEVNPS